MMVFGYFVVGVYVLCLSYIAIYCVFQFHLLLHYRGFKNKNSPARAIPELPSEVPFVTIQLPLFNEYYVIERLIDNIVKLDYPKDKFEIHILDDSTDETVVLSQNKVDQYSALGFNIKLITREIRTGYKAGALRDAMPYANGEFIAIFDADFLPEPDFLLNTIPYFNNSEVGVVQTRWGHINQDYSLLTELQAFQLNVHFTVEQQGREAGNYFLQFNGTAGVWRRATIDDSGGWEADTLTEDLDLSYRAQLQGWKFVFLEDILSPAELPVEMNGLKSQQHRWMKGGAETAMKLLPKIWSSNLPSLSKIHATTHLLASSIFLSVFLIGIFSVPLVFVINPLNLDMRILSLFFVSTLFISMTYYVANVSTAWKDKNKFHAIIKFAIVFPVFLALSMGLSLHNSLAVLQGYLGRKSAFIRTPKFNIKKVTDSFVTEKYKKKKLSNLVWVEGLLSLYFLFGIVAGFNQGQTSMMIFHILLFLGYGSIFFYSVKHMRYQS